MTDSLQHKPLSLHRQSCTVCPIWTGVAGDHPGGHHTTLCPFQSFVSVPASKVPPFLMAQVQVCC